MNRRKTNIELTSSAPSAPDNHVEQPLVSGVILTPDTGAIPVNEYRRYAGRISTTLRTDTRVHYGDAGIQLNLTRRFTNDAQKLVIDRDKQVIVHRTDLGDTLASEAAKSMAKIAPAAGQIDWMDFMGMLRFMGEALAIYSVDRVLTWEQYTRGMDVPVRVLKTLNGPLGAAPNCVYVPTAIMATYGAHTFSAFIGAATAVGSTIYTDVLQIEPNGRPIIEGYNGIQLAAGIYKAARILIQMYDISNDGAAAIFAFVKGIHSGLSVVGHTDEGSYMRDVFRRLDFVPSSGPVVNVDKNDYLGMPFLAELNSSNLSGIIDSIALTSAALVAPSGDVISIDERKYPYVSIIPEQIPIPQANAHADQWNQVTTWHANNICNTCYNFCNRYISNLSWLFGVRGVDMQVAAILRSMFVDAIQLQSRHLRYGSVAPYYWVEPTCILRRLPPITSEGVSDPLAGINEPITRSVLNERDKYSPNGPQHYMLIKEFSTLRQFWLSTHCIISREDGMNAMLPAKFVSAAMSLTGPNGDPAEMRGLGEHVPQSLNQYRWRHGHCQIPAPCEMVYMGKNVGIMMMTALGDILNMRRTSLPSADEIANAKITFTATALSHHSNGALGEIVSGIDRRHKRALAQLGNLVQNEQLSALGININFIGEGDGDENIVDVGGAAYGEMIHVDVAQEQEVEGQAEPADVAVAEPIMHDGIQGGIRNMAGGAAAIRIDPNEVGDDEPAGDGAENPPQPDNV